MSQNVDPKCGDEQQQQETQICSASAASEKSTFPVTEDDDGTSNDDDEVDLEELEEYSRQVRESDGFDVDYFGKSYLGIKPYQVNDDYVYTYDIQLYSRLGLHCYNLRSLGLFFGHYITLEAMDTSNNSPCTFQTCVWQGHPSKYGYFFVQTELSRLKVPTGPRTTNVWLERKWEDDAIDEFYRGEMPNWLTNDELAADKDKRQYYELQESDLLGNDWLHLFAEFALYLNWRGYASLLLKRFLPLKIKKVFVQTQESGEESPHLKLKANNAIFFMSFKATGDHPSGKPVEYQAIVRKTMDGKPGHIRLEVESWAGAYQATCDLTADEPPESKPKLECSSSVAPSK